MYHVKPHLAFISLFRSLSIFTRIRRVWFCAALILTIATSCNRKNDTIRLEPPDVLADARTISADALALDASKVEPMYRALLPIDLYTVIRTAAADNIEIKLARYRVEQSQGRYESTVGGAFPVLVPTALFEQVDGSVRATEGNIVNVGFNTFQPSIAVQWIINPGRVIYEIIASKKRLRAAEHQEEAVRMETLRTAAVQYYTLVLTQARVAAADQAVVEAHELLRINRLRSTTGAGVPADELRAEARLAERQQDLTLAMNALYKASLALTETLQLADPTITLVPRLEELPPINLVREDVEIGDLLDCAVEFRPDLRGVRELIQAAKSDRGATWWGGFGPQFSASYQYGGIIGHANNTDKGGGIPSNLLVNPFAAGGAFSPNPATNAVIREGFLRTSRNLDHNRDQTFSFSDQHKVTAGVSARWSLSAFGDLKAASAAEQKAILSAERAILQVKTQVIDAAQTSKTNKKLIAMANRQMASAEEALRLTQASLEAGAMTTLDVLQSQDAVAQARLRHAEAVVRYNQAEVNLLAAIGLLNADTIALIGSDSGKGDERTKG
ncbi:MAG: TolC family protein [Phycisphaerae bacterium]